MSDLVVNEMLPVDSSKLITKKFAIKRCGQANLGIRMWYVLYDEQNKAYQRYSLLMNPTDEVLLTAKVGDVVEIQYYVDQVADIQYQRFEPFARNTIVSAKYV